MKFLRADVNGSARVGVATDDGAVLLPNRFTDVVDVIQGLPGSLEIAARDEDGGVRAVELRDHPFFIGTLFQPERAALRGETPPLVKAFVEAVARG